MENSFTISISLVALILSGLALFQNHKYEKRQLRVEKLEEMLEISHILLGCYQYFQDTVYFKESLINGNTKETEKYKQTLKNLQKIAKEIDLQKKLPRLFVLNNSYLPKKELNEKIGLFIGLYTSIAEATIGSPHKSTKLPFNDFPKPWHFMEFTQEIQNGLIEEMELGFKPNINGPNSYEKKI